MTEKRTMRVRFKLVGHIDEAVSGLEEGSHCLASGLSDIGN